MTAASGKKWRQDLVGGQNNPSMSQRVMTYGQKRFTPLSSLYIAAVPLTRYLELQKIL